MAVVVRGYVPVWPRVMVSDGRSYLVLTTWTLQSRDDDYNIVVAE